MPPAGRARSWIAACGRRTPGVRARLIQLGNDPTRPDATSRHELEESLSIARTWVSPSRAIRLRMTLATVSRTAIRLRMEVRALLDAGQPIAERIV
jgi:hypothetical protein